MNEEGYGNCATCRFAGAAEADHLRLCRSASPALVQGRGVWPVVREDDWCGEYESADD